MRRLACVVYESWRDLRNTSDGMGGDHAPQNSKDCDSGGKSSTDTVVIISKKIS